jgi:hypothetical protein
METIFITNGDVQLVLVPKNELDRLLLAKLTESGPVMLEHISQPIGILGQSVKDALVLKPKIQQDAKDKDQDL